MINKIVTGEKIQQTCNLYIGKIQDFNFNPIIKNQTNKHLNIDLINTNFENPYYIFCYSHLINEFSYKIQYFKNNFVLITHNSDQNIEFTENIIKILNSTNLVQWYAQNLLFKHDKLNLLPIGLANSMWSHGNLSPFNDLRLTNNLVTKTKFIYFNFNINTNISKRKPCYESLKSKLTWLENINPTENLYRLKEYEFCICPEGNGVDTHRLWECLYLKVVPIVINTQFTQILKNYNVPMVVLDKWDDIEIMKFTYTDYNFDNDLFNNLLDYNKLIHKINT
jgi:hypothetical protein